MVFDSFSSRAQASVEYLTLVGTVLIIVALLSGYAFTIYSGTTSNSQALEAFLKVKKAIETVYALGEGNSIVIDITLPNGVSAFSASGKSIVITFDAFGSSASDLAEFSFDVSGTLPTLEGTHSIRIANSSGVVSLNEIP
jgi:uncharacterized protein (UPF0333 family)